MTLRKVKHIAPVAEQEETSPRFPFSYQTLLILLSPWWYQPVSWGSASTSRYLIGWQRPDRLGWVVSVHWSAQRAVLIGWQKADSGAAASVAQLLMRQLQVLIDRSNNGFWQSGWLAGCHFEFKVVMQLFHINPFNYMTFGNTNDWLFISTLSHLCSDPPLSHCLAEPHIHCVFNW